jgi:serine/threonine protein kinase
MSAEPDPQEAPPIGTKVRGTYELVRFLGAGGMGAVYEAITPEGVHVALKVLLHGMLQLVGNEAVQRFKREANVTGVLESKHVTGVIDAGVDDALGLPFLVMPLLSGLDVAGLVEKVGPLHPTVAVRILRQASEALRMAHGLGVVHRDIKPANLFLDHEPSGAITVRVLDFGIAKWKAEESALTQTGTALGTPHYMAPEQMLNAKHTDPRADVWSLGATLYEMLSGVVPFQEVEGFVELHLAMQSQEVAPLQDHAPWIDPGLATVVHGALLRKVDARCPSVAELYEALGPYTFGSDDLAASMLEPLPETMRTSRAKRAEVLGRWLRVEPSVLPPPPLETRDDPLLGLQLGGRFRLLRRIGRGGMGSVYEAEDLESARYAVKVIDAERAGKDPAARRRFVREARAAGSVSHPNVVRLVHADTDIAQGLPYIVMDLLKGRTLDGQIVRYGACDPSATARMFVDACSGIGAAHALHLVHRDIKPANLFLHRTPRGEVVVKICDFGIAKQLLADGSEDTTANLTRTGGVIGSPMYMSPEQAKNAKQVDHRTDIWSLGASLYEALTGNPPWHGRTTVGELILAIYTERPVPLLDLAPWVPAGLADVVERALARDPAARFQSMAELAGALGPFCLDTPTLTVAALRPVSEMTRVGAQALRRSSMVTSNAATAATQLAPPPDARGKRLLWAGGALAGVAALATGGFFLLARAGSAGVASGSGTTAGHDPGAADSTEVAAPDSSAAPITVSPVPTAPIASASAATAHVGPSSPTAIASGVAPGLPATTGKASPLGTGPAALPPRTASAAPGPAPTRTYKEGW